MGNNVKVGGVYVEIQAKMDRLEADLKSIEGRLQTTNQKAENFASSFKSIAALAAGSVIAQKMFQIGKSALAASAAMEQNRVAFTTMLGGAEKAQALLDQMQQFAASTPFEFNEIVEAGKRMVAFGFSSGEVVEKLRMLGDVSAGLGVPLGDMTYLFGQIKTQGRAMTQDLMQFANRGVPIYDELAKVLGVDVAQVKQFAENGKIGFKEIEQVFINLTKEGGKFAGLMDAQSKTLAGRWSNFNDQLDKTLVIMGDKMAPAAGTWLDFANNVMGAANSAGQETNSTFSKISDTALGVVSPLKSIFDYNTWILDKANQYLLTTQETSNELLSQVGITAWYTGTTEKAFKQITDLTKKYQNELRSGKHSEVKDTKDKAKKETEIEKTKFEKFREYYSIYAGEVTNITGQLSQLSSMYASNQDQTIDNETQKKQDALDAQYEAQLAAIDAELLSDSEKEAKKTALKEQYQAQQDAIDAAAEKKKRKLAREQAKISKELSLFETIITTPQAAMDAYASLAKIPFVGPALGLAAAISTTALGVAKMKLIQDQPLPALAQGGIVPALPGGRQVIVGEGKSSEAVIPLDDRGINVLKSALQGSVGSNAVYLNVYINDDYRGLYKASQNGHVMIDKRAIVA